MPRFAPWALVGLLGCTADPTTPVLEEQCDGFSATSEAWDVPEPFVYDFFMTGREGVGNYWSLFDLDGDGLLDLIQHHHGNHADAEKMGANWYVWWNSGSGFGARTVYALPVDHRELSGLYAANFVEAILDITGDGVADLVRPQDPKTRDVWDADGDRHWRVHPGTARDGFAAEHVAWSIPEPFDGAVHSDRTSGFSWTTFDLDGDGVVELVHTVSTEDAGTWGFSDGSPHWRVYRNEGDGFDARFEAWDLPDMPDGRNGWFADHTNILPQKSVRTQDLTGDGLPDLVVPRDAAWPNPIWGGDDAPHWRVYPNRGDHFDLEWIDWEVPDSTQVFPGNAADWIIETSDTWDTLVTGAGMPNLLVAGKGGWAVYRNHGAGFDSTPTPWATPDPVFTALWGTGGAVAEGWTTLDLNGDGCLDLLLTDGLDLGIPDASTTAWAWSVWPGE